MTDRELYSVLPLEDYRLGGQRLERVRLAEDRLAAACMNKRGVEWNPPPISERDADPEFRRYGIIRLDTARTSGYRPADDPARERRNHYFLKELTPEQNDALLGEEGQPGCLAKAGARLGRDAAATEPMLIQSLGQRSLRKSGELRAVKRVEARWSACMKSEGYRYPDPRTAASDPAWNFEQPPSKRELAVATADATCKEKVRLAEIWSAEEAKVQRRMIAENSTELKQVRRAVDNVLANATANANATTN